MGRSHNRRKAKTDSKLNGKTNAYFTEITIPNFKQETKNISISTLTGHDSDQETGSSKNITTSGSPVEIVSAESGDLRQRDSKFHIQSNAESEENVSKMQTKKNNESENNPVSLLQETYVNTANREDQEFISASLTDKSSRKKKKKHKGKNLSKVFHSSQTDVKDVNHLKEEVDKNNEQKEHKMNDEELSSSLTYLSKQTKSADYFLETDQSADVATDMKNKTKKSKHSRKNAPDASIGGRKSELLPAERNADHTAIQTAANKVKQAARKEFVKRGKEVHADENTNAASKLPKKKKCRKTNRIQDDIKRKMENSAEKETEIDGTESKSQMSIGNVSKMETKRSDDQMITMASEAMSCIEQKCDMSTPHVELPNAASMPENMQMTIAAVPQSMHDAQCSRNADNTGGVANDKSAKEERTDCEKVTVPCDDGNIKENFSKNQASAFRFDHTVTGCNVSNSMDYKTEENASDNVTDSLNASCVPQVQPRPEEETDPVILRDQTEFQSLKYEKAELLHESKFSAIDKIENANGIDNPSNSCLNLSSKPNGPSSEEMNARDENLINL